MSGGYSFGVYIGYGELKSKKITELYQIAKNYGVENPTKLKRKTELIKLILTKLAESEGFSYVEGILDIWHDGYGLLKTGYDPNSKKVYVAQTQIAKFGLRKGDVVGGKVRPPKENEKWPSLVQILMVNYDDPEKAINRPRFEDLIPIYPDRRITMEFAGCDVSNRIIDLLAPIGRGQRGLIVSAPKAGKTTLLKNIAKGIIENYISKADDMTLFVLLVDERPEEVTDFREWVGKYGEVVASTFDQPAERHVRVVELLLERAKRMVELGHHVVILLDSITRLARAYNAISQTTGRTLSGGVELEALQKAKSFFGAARNIKNGGSLTIIATALVETGSRMDDVIFEEFKGTGNMEIHLDRKIADRRIFPAINIPKSGTRHEELLIPEKHLEKVWLLRRYLTGLGDIEAIRELIVALRKYPSNEEFLQNLELALPGIRIIKRETAI